MIYLDFAATTKPSRESLEIFAEINEKFWANPESSHDFGIKAEAILQHSRKNILESFNANEQYNLIFTSSATESNNLVIKSVANLRKNEKKHIISSNIEHPSVREVLFFLEKEGFDVEFLPVNENGVLSVEQVEKAMRKDTILVSIMHVNNEIGSINDVFEMAKAVKEKNNTAIFHSDFSQSVGKLPVDLKIKNSAIDFISFSGHKIECIKGIAGVLFRKNIAIFPLLHGGEQEFGFRASTANPAAAAALAKSVKTAVKNQQKSIEKVKLLQEILLENLQKFPEIQINSPKENSPFIVNFSVIKQKSETILRALSQKEIYVSTVSACSSKKNMESYVIKAITNDEKRALSSMRVSLSSDLSENDILTFAKELKDILENL
ncbi:MAG: cysteine desulfurase [Chitinivibrionia bacterium]|nr:cysteine desulfurase [Chitinivibrionia bacterium]